jgi:hypothetical protein
MLVLCVVEAFADRETLLVGHGRTVHLALTLRIIVALTFVGGKSVPCFAGFKLTTDHEQAQDDPTDDDQVKRARHIIIPLQLHDEAIRAGFGRRMAQTIVAREISPRTRPLRGCHQENLVIACQLLAF